MDRAGIAVKVTTEVVIHFICVGTDGERTNLKDHLVLPRRVDRSGRYHHLRARLTVNTVDVLFIVDLGVFFFALFDLIHKLVNVYSVAEAEVSACALTGNENIIAFVLSANRISGRTTGGTSDGHEKAAASIAAVPAPPAPYR